LSEIILSETASVSTPSAGKTKTYADTTGVPCLRFVDDAGNNRCLAGISNFSVASQAPSATARTYLIGSAIAVPVNKLQIGTTFEWVLSVTKTAFGTATSTYDICVGTAGAVADVARVSFTKPAGTGAVDQGTIVIKAIVRSIGAAGVMVGDFAMTHNLAGTGHAIIPCVNVVTVSSGFDMTVANLIVGVCVTSGASDVLTFQLVTGRADNI